MLENSELFKIKDTRLVKYLGAEDVVVIPENVRSISAQAFAQNSSIRKVIIHEDVELIGSLAFANCSNLSDIEIKSNNTIIGEGAFDRTFWYNMQNEGLLCIKNTLCGIKGKFDFSKPLKDGIETISPFSLSYLSNIRSIALPKSLKRIQSKAFYHCEKLERILIWENVEFIANDAFDSCHLTIVGKENSYAYLFAKENNIPFDTPKIHFTNSK